MASSGAPDLILVLDLRRSRQPAVGPGVDHVAQGAGRGQGGGQAR
jgi:hypothetical protein